MKASLCPVCNGRGKLPPQQDFSDYFETTCHGCAGKGWVEVQEDSPLPFHWQPGPIGDNAKCPACGGDRNSPGGTGCPMGSHYGSYCEG